MLTIGQLADYVGVTVRAVRHYHERGLLPEPTRDASGYRRYDAQAVLDLVRIKILSDAGVPLARIDELLDAPPERFAEAVADIDAALQEQVRELERRRRRIADLVAGERLVLPDALVAFLDELRAAGIGPRTVQSERDAWILLIARHPRRADELLAEKRARLADPEFRRLYRAYDRALDWDPDDPRLESLADAAATYVMQHAPSEDDVPENWTIDDPTTIALLGSVDAPSPSLERLNALAEEQLARRRGGDGR